MVKCMEKSSRWEKSQETHGCTPKEAGFPVDFLLNQFGPGIKLGWPDVLAMVDYFTWWWTQDLWLVNDEGPSSTSHHQLYMENI